jgi:hypothetical protein
MKDRCMNSELICVTVLNTLLESKYERQNMLVKKLMSLRLICFMLFASLLVGSQVLFLINDLFWKNLFNVQKSVMSILVKFSFYSSFNSL